MHLYSSSIPDRPVHIVSAVEPDDTSRALSLFSSSSILRVLGWDLEGKLIDRMWCLVLVFKEVTIDVLALTRGLKFLMVNSKLYDVNGDDRAYLYSLASMLLPDDGISMLKLSTYTALLPRGKANHKYSSHIIELVDREGLVTKSAQFDLSSMFEENKTVDLSPLFKENEREEKEEMRFATARLASCVISKLEEVAEAVKFGVRFQGLENRKRGNWAD
ncbi:hypothetical protein RJ639_039722 [Escallonia herrerae]|uniref:NAF domain-containing protein n=1 Tax=Escallonia herrerae TaxID=1293975 RepID=A0AA88WL09_9ASTE|nr:hypothetical protein RJ639_039722 [Escallonia herrerae]